MPKLILASASSRRVSLLKQIGYEPDLIVPADIDESSKKGESPRALALRLALEKANKIAALYPDDVILAADTVVSVGRLVLPKALTEEDALYCLQKMSGRRHRVYTGVCVISHGRAAQRVCMTVVKFKVLSPQDIKNFISTKQWFGKAGGYALQGISACFVEYLRGLDTNVVGLPASVVYKLLHGVGVHANPQISYELL